VDRLLASRLVDAIVVNPHQTGFAELQGIRVRFPDIPVVAFAPFRPDDGELLLHCHDQRVTVLIEGVDDAAAGELVGRSSATSALRRSLAEAPRMLRLAEPLQLRVWNLLLERVDRPIRTGAIATRLRVSREHLSRQFGAGGAPNLKRVIDLTRVACAAQLLANPGYDVRTVVRLLDFASASHLSGTSRRIAGVRSGELGQVGPRGVLAAFARGNTRSRIGGR
jgi:AraC-like DNA-binding protein